jgi:hypothetical protein
VRGAQAQRPWAPQPAACAAALSAAGAVAVLVLRPSLAGRYTACLW